MHSLRFFLDISAEEYLRYYQGRARYVLAFSHDGRRVQFPAEHLRRFVLHDGVRGEFELRFDAHSRFLDLRRVGELP